MPIVSTDIKYFLSGGAANADPNASIGGAKSATEMNLGVPLNNLWDNVSGAESAAGDVEYRMVYLQNKHATLTLQGAKVFIQANTPSADTDIAIGLAAAGLNGVETAVANENTAPAGVTFSSAAGEGAALAIGNMAPDDFIGLWVRRTVTAGAAAVNGDAYTLRVQGDTAA